MKGANELHLNEATMLLAIQHYFETVTFVKAPKVLSVDMTKEGNYVKTFIVKVEGEEP